LSTKTTKIIILCHKVHEDSEFAVRTTIAALSLELFVKTKFDFYSPRKFFSSAMACDITKLTSEMESTHKIVLGNRFLDDLERVALHDSESEPIPLRFFDSRVRESAAGFKCQFQVEADMLAISWGQCFFDPSDMLHC